MKRDTYLLIENYMLSCMRDSAHDKEHVYRVLYNAMEIAKHEETVDYDVLICACLLHDIGIARTLIYKGQVAEPLYTLDAEGNVSNGENDTTPSFFQEYKYKLEHVYDKFYTDFAATAAKQRRKAAVTFYEDLLSEVSTVYEQGKDEVRKHMEGLEGK